MTKLLNEGIQHFGQYRCIHCRVDRGFCNQPQPYRDYKLNGTIIRVRTLCEMETGKTSLVQLVEELLQEAKEQILHGKN